MVSFDERTDTAYHERNLGLCATCIHVEACEYLKSFGPAKINCDEFEGIESGVLNAIIDKHNTDHGGLISILEAIQTKYSYLPEKALRLVADRTGRSLVAIYGVATFYKSFSLKPRGKHIISVCLGTACHVRGGPNVAREVERQLGIKDGETTPDRNFTLQTVNCLGACALGPVVVVDGHYFSNVDTANVKSILEKASKGLDEIDIETDKHVFPLTISCPCCNHALMDPGNLIDGHPSIRVTISFGRKHGWMRLSGVYGSYRVESEYSIPTDTVIDFFCPHCHAEIIGATDCPSCGAPMVAMIVRGGGMLQICSRRGCRSHLLDLV